MDATLEVLTEDGGRLRNRKSPDVVQAQIVAEIRGGLMTLSHAQLKVLRSGLDGRRVRVIEARAPGTVE